uniref:Uncharacterized protein n=1 Tax=Peronospora matthiolae TaxID=2874970 RepID=A0AAV1UYM3_9STRA
MDQDAQGQVQAPASTQTDDDRASKASGASEGMARLLELITDLKGDMGACLNRLEARRVEDDQGSVVSAGSSTFRTYAEARTGFGRNMTMASLEGEVMPGTARQHAAGPGQQRLAGGRAGVGPVSQVPRESAFRPVPTPAYFAPQRPLQIRDINRAIENFDGKEVYPGLGSGFAPCGKRLLRQVRIAEELSGCIWTVDIKMDVLGRYLTGKAGQHFHSQVDTWYTKNPQIWYSMDRMNIKFGPRISRSQSFKLFTCKKKESISWNDHVLYLILVSDAVGCAQDQVLENIAKYACSATDFKVCSSQDTILIVRITYGKLKNW